MENSTNETNEGLNETCATPPQPAFEVAPLFDPGDMKVVSYLCQCLLCDMGASAWPTIELSLDAASQHYTEAHFGK
jgi:hypothetical protein